MKYAIVESGGKQYKAVEGGTLEVDRLPAEPGTKLKLEKVLLLAEEGTITVGAPVIKDSPIWTKVIEHFKGDKVTIFNYSPKKRIRVKTGHRQNYTRLLVEQIGGKELIARKETPKAVEVEKSADKAAEGKTSTKPRKAEAQKPASKTPTPSGKSAAKKPAEKSPSKVEKTVRSADKAEVSTKKPATDAEKPAKGSTKKPAAAAKKPAGKK
jgi:large subunit ribosomal protein L21